MISKAQTKFIKSLQLKKYRMAEQCFVVEGAKSVVELLGSAFKTITLIASRDFVNLHRKLIPKDTEVWEAGDKELSALGSYQTNDAALAIAKMSRNEAPVFAPGEWGLVLDDIRDPGNLGTILRTADWYGIKKIIASESSADFYNPKVIAASMGSFTRVSAFYTGLSGYLGNCRLPLYGTFLDGANIHEMTFDQPGLVVIGNESSGISPGVAQFITHRITIPGFGKAESLNAAIATAVVLDNIRRSEK